MKHLILSLTTLGLGLLTLATAAADERSNLEKMAEQHQHDKPVASPATVPAPAQDVTADAVTYGAQDGKALRGYLARPRAGKGALPAIIVIHEWWGLNDNIRAVTRRLAGEGYTALAVDLYGGAAADNPDAAMKLMSSAMQNKPAAEANLRHAYDYLKKQSAAPRIGVIGWCFGGGWSLATALLVPEGIDATVMYYGHPETDKEKLAHLRSPLIGFFGADDGSIPAATVRQFESTLKGLGKDVEVHIYDGAGHAFANPSGTNYRPAAADDAWARTVAFLKRTLGVSPRAAS
ncbi:MAG: dienelactone hydrolase family protein [Acidobacteriota bacterium]|nr:dienelactone hydrolase family protein [Acidobacteriota bacterium]